MKILRNVESLFWKIVDYYEKWNKTSCQQRLEVLTLEEIPCTAFLKIFDKITMKLLSISIPGFSCEASKEGDSYTFIFNLEKEFFIYSNGKIVVKRCENDKELRALISKLIPNIDPCKDIGNIRYTVPCAEVLPRYEAYILNRLIDVDEVIKHIETIKPEFHRLEHRKIVFLDKQIINGTIAYHFILKFTCRDNKVSSIFYEKYPILVKLDAPIIIFKEIISIIKG
ncbi:MAG: hypothetical protein ACTSSP_10870 [Candidatus Asgardarchaeia archaeon]